MTFAKSIESFLEYLKSIERRKETIDTYRKQLDRFNRYLYKEKNCQIYFDEVTGDDLENYIKYQQNNKVLPASIFSLITAFKSFMNYCYKIGITKIDIARQIKQINPGIKERTYLTEKELERLFEATDHEIVRPAIMSLYYAGLRINECINLKLDDVDFDKNQIIVTKDKEKNKRIIPINYKLREELIYYLENHRIDKGTDYFFSTRTGRLSDSHVNRIIKEATKKAEINKEITCHILRHSFASNLVQKGIDIYKVKKLLGHNSINTTSIYLHANIGELRKAVNLIG